ncbi:MAG TPA: DUF4193 family protein [Actinomycetota bacterium]|nr:DUF4193 family protein [Actinomycetota bacterium]
MAERDDEREDGDTEVVEEDPEEVEPTEEDLEDAAGTVAEPAAVAADVESIQDVLEKQEARDEEDDVEDEPLAAVATTRGEERLEPLDARVIPMQSTEFVCKNCYLVKHRSQLADKRRMLCRDCA